MISVIIPFHDDYDTLTDTLASVYWQTYRDFEIIVIDDGSKDPLEEVFYRFCGNYDPMPNVTLLTQKNSGVASARNNGISNAKGEFILPLDSDDILVPTCLERMVSKLGQADIIYCNYLLFGTEHFIVNVGKYEKDKLKRGNQIVNSSLFRKSVWEDIKKKNGTGYDEDIPTWEDWLFWLEADLLGKKFAFLPEWLFMYRKGAGRRDQFSLSNRAELRKYIDDKTRRIHKQTIEV